MIEIADRPVAPQEVEARLQRAIHGAVVTFAGTVRSPSEGKVVRYLEYEAYPGMAEKKMAQIEAEARARWLLEDIIIVHRIGRLEVGEASLVVAVAAQHRKEAFEACRWAVDTVKETVPVWKKEVWLEGAAWVNCHGH
ncbi:MAG: molybdenum cofactor biosynthesis protein MoaE [Chloroflexi bacterium]|nr:molybdenum cofactor biosynthesis protein MoaE [Chloroflexota bacterium]